MKRMTVLLVLFAVVLSFGASAEITVPDKYGTLIELLEAGKIEAAKLEFDDIVSGITGQTKEAAPGLLQAKIGDTIDIGSFSLRLNELHVIDGQVVPFDTDTIGGPQMGTDYPDEGAHRIYITGDISTEDDSVELRNHVYGKLVIGDETFYSFEAYNSEGKFYILCLVPSDIVPYLENASFQVYFKDTVRFGEWIDEENYDVAYEISLVQP